MTITSIHLLSLNVAGQIFTDHEDGKNALTVVTGAGRGEIFFNNGAKAIFSDRGDVIVERAGKAVAWMSIDDPGDHEHIARWIHEVVDTQRQYAA